MEQIFLHQLGKRIAFLRKQKAFSQEEFAERSGKMINTISNIERGISDPKITTLLSFAQTLEVPLEALIENDQPDLKETYSELITQITNILKKQDEHTLKIVLKQIKALVETE